jgi:hypothetical protein
MADFQLWAPGAPALVPLELAMEPRLQLEPATVPNLKMEGLIALPLDCQTLSSQMPLHHLLKLRRKLVYALLVR